MHMRWFILFVLFFARTAMAFQFQSVAALSPLIIEHLALTLVDIGLLIGLYLGPGVIVATLGGTVATWFGDKRTVVASLCLMVLGGVMVAFAETLGLAIAGRAVSGIGGVVINVLMTKMVIDWFAGHKISTALAIFISSWPLGIALSLLVLPALATAGGLAFAWQGLITLTVAALILFAVIYRTPEGVATADGKISMASIPWVPLSYAGLLWGLYNAAFAMVFGFGTLILIERGMTNSAASSATSLYMLVATLAIPLGGWIADRTGRRNTVILVSLIGGVVLFPALLYLPVALLAVVFAFGGLVIGLAPGPIVSMPGLILSQEARAFGTGIFYSIYYVLMMIAPPLAGAIADHQENVGATFVLGAVMMGLAIVTLFAFNRTAVQPSADQ